MHTQNLNPTISIVEGNAALRQEVVFQLEQRGFMVKAFENATGFYRYLALRPKTIAILNIDLPDEDGLTICKHLRTHDQGMGVIFITTRGNRNNRLAGLSAGSDAYLVMPADIEELVLILKRITLRNHNTIGLHPHPHPHPHPVWHLEPNSMFLISPNGVRVRVTNNEARILGALLKDNDAPCSHVELGLALDLLPDEFDKHRIEVILSRLNNKVHRLTGMRLPLNSIRGVGYSLYR